MGRLPPLANTEDRYGWIAILLHWAMAALPAGLVVLAINMVRLPDSGYGREKITLILARKAAGMVALAAVLARLALATDQRVAPFCC